MATGKMISLYHDYQGEPSSVTIPTLAQTGTGLDAHDALLDTAIAAIEALMIDPSKQAETRVYNFDDPKPGDSTNPLNQRECKLLITGRDSVTGKVRKMEIPGFNLTKLSPVDKNIVDITAGDGLAAKNALEAVWVNPDTGNSIDVEEMRHVGRNT